MFLYERQVSPVLSNIYNPRWVEIYTGKDADLAYAAIALLEERQIRHKAQVYNTTSRLVSLRPNAGNLRSLAPVVSSDILTAEVLADKSHDLYHIFCHRDELKDGLTVLDSAKSSVTDKRANGEQ